MDEDEVSTTSDDDINQYRYSAVLDAMGAFDDPPIAIHPNTGFN